jgi:hypothetical protein
VPSTRINTRILDELLERVKTEHVARARHVLPGLGGAGGGDASFGAMVGARRLAGGLHEPPAKTLRRPPNALVHAGSTTHRKSENNLQTPEIACLEVGEGEGQGQGVKT